MKKLLIILIVSTFSVVFLSCSGVPLTDISGSWKKPGYSGKKFQNILVIAISNDIVKRSTVEKSLVKYMKEAKLNAAASSSVLTSDIKMDNSGRVDTTNRGELKSKIESMGYDGVVVVSLLDIKDKQKYVQGSTYYAPSHNYLSPGYGFSNYWYSSYQMVQTPGYYVNDQYVFLETTLFDVKTEELLWSAESETVNPSNIQSLSASYSPAIVEKMLSKKAVLP